MTSVPEKRPLLDNERKQLISQKLRRPQSVGGGLQETIGTAEEHTEIELVAKEEGDSFIYSSGLTSQEANKRLEIYGKNELPDKSVPKWQIFLGLLIQPMPIMIWIAALIEYCIDNTMDMWILLFIQFANASIGFYEVTKAGDAVAALKSSLKPTATVFRDGKFKTMDASLLVPGDLVLLASGSAGPASPPLCLAPGAPHLLPSSRTLPR